MDKPHINTQQNLADKLQVTQPHISNKMKEYNLRFPKVQLGNSLAEKKPYSIQKWHSENQTTPYDVSFGSNKKYLFLEPKTEDHPWSDHEWCGQPNDLTDKCAVCEGKHVVYSNSLKGVAEQEWDKKTKKWTVNDNARIALKEWDYDKNPPPQQVIAYSNKKYYFNCTKNRHSYCSILNNRVGKGHECQQCTNTGARVYTLDPQFSLATKEPEKAKLFLRLLSENEEKELEKMQRLQTGSTNSIQVLKWKEIKTKTTGPNEITHLSNKYAWWRCDKEPNNPLHYHPTTITNKVQKGGCSVCSNYYITRANSLRTYVETRSPELDFIKEIFVKIVEGNIGIDDKRWKGSGPDNFGPDSHFKTEWECINYKHNTKTSIAHRVKDKQSCGQCQPKGKAAYLIYKDLKEEFFNDIKREYNLKQEYDICAILGDLDMYIPSLKLAIEFDPDFTHQDKNQNLRDQKKVDIVELAGCKIIRLREKGLNPIGDNCVIFEKYNGKDKNLKGKVMPPLLEKIEKLFPKTISEKKLQEYNKLPDFKYRKEAETELLNKDKSYQPNLF